MNQIPLHKRIKKIFKNWHSDGVKESDCLSCSSGCCSHGGFAVLENMLLIYEKYIKGDLVREDYQFTQNLSFSDFVWKYFDVYSYPTGGRFSNKLIVIFHMKSLTSENELIAIPEGGSYWEIRYSLFQRNPWLNKGCIFLNKKVPNWPEDDHDSSRKCILHNSLSNKYVTEKPIDCVFFTCTKPMTCKDVTEKISLQWRRALALSFPDSEERFQKLLDIDSKENSNSKH